MSLTRIRWAILGTGAVAQRFASDMRFSATGRVVAVGSRTKERASALAARICEHTAAGLYKEIIGRDDIDAVYLATSNASHAELAISAITAGKPVMVEKPLAACVKEAEAVAAAASRAGLLVMEAMWMRFTPGLSRLRQLVGSGAIGEIRQLDANLAFAHAYRPNSPQFDPRTGGALLDLGVYVVSLTLQLLGKPSAVTAQVSEAPNGSVLSANILLHYDQAHASLSCGLGAEGPNEAIVTGTKGILRAHRPFFCPPAISLRRTGASASAPERTEPAPIDPKPRFARTAALKQMRSNLRARPYPTLYVGTGLHYQADHFAECLRKGVTDSTTMPLEHSVETLRILEAVRRAGA